LIDGETTVTASAYIDPVADPLRPLTAGDIETAFGKPAGWFGRDRVRKRLYAQGFPHPFERGLWSAKAVADADCYQGPESMNAL
jgi:hypothetical protein